MKVIRCPHCNCGALVEYVDDFDVRIEGPDGEIKSTVKFKNVPSFYCLNCKKRFDRKEDFAVIARTIEKVNRRISGI